ncbi:MAG: hypothetical protein KBA61_04975 [Spirochaetes bacterium]|nr:hypothetical protein [Spirochaetota bacterium]
MKAHGFSLLLACSVVFPSSCYIYFTSPPFTSSEMRMDEDLLGTWERAPESPRDFSAKYRFTRRSGTVMDVWGESDNFLAVTCRVGAARYLMVWDPDDKVTDAPKEFPGPYYTIIPYTVTGDRFTFRVFDLKKFGKLFQEKKLKGFSSGGGQWTPPSLYVTSPPSEARKAIEEKGFDYYYIAGEGEWSYRRVKEN